MFIMLLPTFSMLFYVYILLSKSIVNSLKVDILDIKHYKANFKKIFLNQSKFIRLVWNKIRSYYHLLYFIHIKVYHYMTCSTH